MPKRLFDFSCGEHVFERFTDDSTRSVPCPQCDKEAIRLVSAPSVKLEGITGAFPGAYDRWERVRAEKQAQEVKKNS